ncbi:MAG: asparaginase domain-containing protein [Clostridiales Family XIII bacterium]|jgi:L-asparaginase|nr:asparaginase domain-containing protein [Clostridiales Family XIII bacterium]
MNAKKLHLIVTGGTIASETSADDVIHLAGTSQTFGEAFLPEISASLHAKAPDDSWEIRCSAPYFIHSENLNLRHLNMLIAHLKEVVKEKPDAMILFVGTDTLAYVSNLLSLLCYGLPIPIYLISANFPIANPESNARANVECALAEICNNASPGVYVPYRNSDGKMYLHHGESLLQAANFSDDFTSLENPEINNLAQICADKTIPLLATASELTAKILAIHPYPGIDYNVFELSGVDAVLHGTYHSYTVSDEKDGFPFLVQKAQQHKIPVYLVPTPGEKRASYTSTANVFKKDLVKGLPELTFEMAYCYLLLHLS